MLIEDDEKGHVIIGEAALHLALAGKEIDFISLIAELGHMATNVSCEKRLCDITKVRSWLLKYARPGLAGQQKPLLQILAGLNEGKH